jgi:His/Glu/Gln/Arg/opine family amino acid ABC transporter permease subunit
VGWTAWCEQLLIQAQGGSALGPWAELNKDFYQAFVQEGRWKMYLEGVGNTLKVAVLALILGVVLGLLVAMVRTFHDQQREERPGFLLGILNAICKVYTTVIRGTPMMVQLLITAFVVFKSSRNLVGVAALAFGINSGAYVAEIIRGGLMSVDAGQMEAGRSLGLNYIQTMRHIIIPQAVKNILPALGNELITLLKETSIVTVIGLRDLTKAAQLVTSKTYGGFMALFGVALVYLAMVMVLTWLMNLLERRLRSSDR